MGEILILSLAIFLVPFLPGQFFWVLLVLLIVLPGTYALRRGPPFVPTSRKNMDAMMALAAIRPGQRVYDLGCGDGRLVFGAAARGAVATGYELSIPVYLVAKFRSFFRRGADVRFGDFWTRDYRDADAIFCYLISGAMGPFQTTIWPQLKPGCRVISNVYRLKDIAPTKEQGEAAMYIKPTQPPLSPQQAATP